MYFSNQLRNSPSKCQVHRVFYARTCTGPQMDGFIFLAAISGPTSSGCSPQRQGKSEVSLIRHTAGMWVLVSEWYKAPTPLQWRHNDHDGVSNHQPHGCSLNRLFRRRSRKTTKLHVTGLCVGNSPWPVNSPLKGPATRKMFPFDDVITPTITNTIAISSTVEEQSIWCLLFYHLCSMWFHLYTQQDGLTVSPLSGL